MSKPIGWGKCFIIAKDVTKTGSKWFLLPTPKEDTTKLSTSKGDKKEATIEGGENEDMKYLKNKYTLEYTIRRNSDRNKPFSDDDGVVADHYAIFVQPENKSVPGPYFAESVVSLEDSFDTSDGGMLAYSHDALRTDNATKALQWATIDQDLSKLKEGEELATDPKFTIIDAAAADATQQGS